MKRVDPMIESTGSGGSLFSDIVEARFSRREMLKFGSAGALLAIGGVAAEAFAASPLGFASVATSTADRLSVPPGYRADVLYAWGDPTGLTGTGPAFRFDAGNTATEQAQQAGMHHDAIEFFPLTSGQGGSTHGLLAINHEYTDESLLHPDGTKTLSAEKTLKSQNAHGVSVIEVQLRGGGWSVVRPSKYARRITARTPMRISGPAAGHALLRTAADPAGLEVLGTMNNCAGGRTPWGTYLTCEENFNGYFAGGSNADHKRYGVGSRAYNRWNETDERFDASKHSNEPNRFGWVVEIDPFDPASKPVKRTALGRMKHEGAMLTLAPDGRAVVYMGDDEPFERIYKFVSRDRFDPKNPAANRDLLDHGTLYAARFDADGSGTWLPLVHGQGPLVAANGFADAAEVLIRTRQAADAVGATRMDRPEWIAVHPTTGEVYCTLTNNTSRGRAGSPGTDPANPRTDNVYGHIIRWRDGTGPRADASATSFRWDIFVLAGDPANADSAKRGNVKGDAFGSPDGLWFDRRGVLWIQTDAAPSQMKSADYANIGNNQMLAADVLTGEIRRFLVGPVGCEITGMTGTPDGRTLFIDVQHPGEGGQSQWPDHRADGRPRSATVAIRREDGGIVGS